MVVREKVKVAQPCSTLCEPHGLLEWVAFPFPRGSYLPNPEIEARSPALQADSLPTELSGKGGGTCISLTWLREKEIKLIQNWCQT